MFDLIQILTDVVNVNTFDVVESRKLHQNTYPVDFYVRLYQSQSDSRYVPESGAKVKIEFMKSDTVIASSTNIVKYMSKPFSSDSSMWYVSLNQNDIAKIPSGGFRIILIEGSKTTTVFSCGSIEKLPSGGIC